MNEEVQILIAKEFSEFPGARYRKDGDNSGQEFYEDLLKPKFKNIWNDDKKTLLIDFDGASGYASSFISQVFTSLVKDFKDKEKIKKKLSFKSNDEPLLIDSVLFYINNTQP